MKKIILFLVLFVLSLTITNCAKAKEETDTKAKLIATKQVKSDYSETDTVIVAGLQMLNGRDCNCNIIKQVKDKNGKLIVEYGEDRNNNKHGLEFRYYSDGSVRSKIEYLHGKAWPSFTRYKPNGEISTIFYKKLVDNYCIIKIYENNAWNILIDGQVDDESQCSLVKNL